MYKNKINILLNKIQKILVINNKYCKINNNLKNNPFNNIKWKKYNFLDHLLINKK